MDILRGKNGNFGEIMKWVVLERLKIETLCGEIRWVIEESGFEADLLDISMKLRLSCRET